MNTVRKQFQDALKREGKTITGYYSQEVYPCLFRKNDKSINDTKEYMTIFYDVNSPIEQGQLLTYGGKYYLTMNKKTVENNVYYKSALLECNTRVIVGVDGIGNIVPCYSSELNSPIPNEGKIMTTLDGNIELITEDNYISRNIEIDNRYILMGGTYQVINNIYKNGIYYFYLQRITSSPPVYSFTVTSKLNTYNVDEEVQLSILPKVDDITDPEATIICTSSDNTIVTVDNKGLVNCIGAGNVTITITWVEQNLLQTITLTVEEDAPLIYKVTITSDDAIDNEIMLGIPHSFIATVSDSLGNPVPSYNLVYSIANANPILDGYITMVDNGDGTCTVQVGDFDDTQLLPDKKFDLVCSDTLSGFFGSMTLTVVGLF